MFRQHRPGTIKHSTNIYSSLNRSPTQLTFVECTLTVELKFLNTASCLQPHMPWNITQMVINLVASSSNSNFTFFQAHTFENSSGIGHVILVPVICSQLSHPLQISNSAEYRLHSKSHQAWKRLLRTQRTRQWSSCVLSLATALKESEARKFCKVVSSNETATDGLTKRNALFFQRFQLLGQSVSKA